MSVRVQRIDHNSGSWPPILTKAFYIILTVYRQAKEFDQTNEYMEKSSEELAFYMLFNIWFWFGFLQSSTLPFLKDVRAKIF